MGLRGVPDKMTNVYENMTYYTVLNQNEREWGDYFYWLNGTPADQVNHSCTKK